MVHLCHGSKNEKPLAVDVAAEARIFIRNAVGPGSCIAP
jgi:hypothetical protein